MRQKAMISQPMKGKTEDEIVRQKNEAVKILEGQGYKIVNTYFDDDWTDTDNLLKKGITSIPLFFLAKSLEKMAECDVIYFCDGWQDARGCKLEHAAAVAYGLKVIYEKI